MVAIHIKYIPIHICYSSLKIYLLRLFKDLESRSFRFSYILKIQQRIFLGYLTIQEIVEVDFGLAKPLNKSRERAQERT